MTAELFVSEYLGQVPDIKLLESLNFPKDFITSEIATYNIDIKEDKLSFDDSVLNLISNYNLKTVVIGMITFNLNLDEDDTYYYIGNFELDIVVKNKRTGVIQILDHDQPSHTISDCAINGDTFLDALIICKGYFNKCMLDDDFYENDIIRFAVIEECAEIAGGKQYIGFYETLLG